MSSVSIPTDLKHIQRRFQQWRLNRTKGSRIPESLWEEATGLARQYGVSRVSNLLALDYPKLRRRTGQMKAHTNTIPTMPSPEFVEVDLQPLELAPSATVRMEKPQGLVMSVSLPGRSTQDLIQVACDLWRQCS